MPLLLVCLALGALSLLTPSAPTYDPYSWIVWGREILELDLNTLEGPSWKPLPVILTTPFSLAGSDVAPQLWLVVARAGGLLALAMTFRLSSRLAGPAAGLIAATGLTLADEFVRNAMLGNSEPLLVGLVLLAIERHLDDRPTHAFALGTAAALMRPELWPFWGLYGLWLARDAPPRRRAAIAAAGATVLTLWFVPEWIGSGNPLRAADRALEPNLDSAAFAERPALEVLRQASLILMIPILVGAGLALLATRRPSAARSAERTLVVALGAAAAALLLVVALMTEAGFAGNLRYVALPAALVCVLAGAGWAGLIRAVADTRAGRAGAALVAVAVAALSIGSFEAPRLALAEDLREAREEAILYDDLSNAIALVGGRRAIDRCGGIYTGRFEVPAVAWELHKHLEDVDVFAIPPGHAFAIRGIALSRDPRFPRVAASRRWGVGRNCGP